jgi:diguanylate cyclase (GGDEF)-like protein
MKSEKVHGSGRTSRPGAVHAVADANGEDGAPPPGPQQMAGPQMLAAAVSVLGIPEAEFTPRVRDAVLTLMTDVERLSREVEQIRTRLDDTVRSADQDVLLPILNRRAFMREVARFISFAERYGTPSSLLYFDLDNFKSVNDAYGHQAGDAVLRHFSDLMASQIRDSDVLARIGGDEFGVILAHVTLDQARSKGEKLAQALSDHQPVWQGERVTLRFSSGVYELHAGDNADAAISHADRIMYEQKRALKLTSR